MRRIDIYIGDGASIKRPLLRRRAGAPIGHAPVAAQLGWCQKAHVRHAIFTHCGSQIVRSDARRIKALLRRLGRERGVEARLAYDGCQLSFPDGGPPQLARQTKKRA